MDNYLFSRLTNNRQQANLLYLSQTLASRYFCVNSDFIELYHREVVLPVIENNNRAAYLHQVNANKAFLDIDEAVGHNAIDIAKSVINADFVYCLSSRDRAHVIYDRPATLDENAEFARAAETDCTNGSLRLPFSRKRAYESNPDIYARLFDSKGSILEPTLENLARFSVVTFGDQI
jgi:hypothetical protein